MRRALELYHHKVRLCLGLAWAEAGESDMGPELLVTRADQLMGLQDGELAELVGQRTGLTLAQLLVGK